MAASVGNMTCGPTEMERVCLPFAILVNKTTPKKPAFLTRSRGHSPLEYSNLLVHEYMNDV